MAANEIDKHLRKRSYVPYSETPEYCIVQSIEGSLFPGVRIENISFPLTVNCVQAATVSCISEGETPLYIYIDSPNTVQKKWIASFELEVHPLAAAPLRSSDLFNPVHTIDSTEHIPWRLEQLSQMAHVGESDFPVAALLRVSDGYIGGVNVEFSDWQTGLCAERTALVKALASGYRKLEEIYLYAPKGTFISPCGACRQLLVEHMPDAILYVTHADGTHSNHFVKHLLPFNFHSKEL